MGLLSKFLGWLNEYEEPASGRASCSAAPHCNGLTDYSDTDTEHAINPATGLPLISGGLLDIGGSLFGTDSHGHDDLNDMFGSSSDPFGNDW